MIENMQERQEQASFFERLEAFLFSRKFIFVVVIAGTIPMIMHSHQLFYNVSPFEGNKIWKNLYALFYAVSFDLTILVFTIHVIKRKPALYAAFVFVINLLYYNPFPFIDPAYIMAFTKIFLAGVLAFTGYSYAELFVEKVAENRKAKRGRKPLDFGCPKCDKRFSSVKALNGHMKAH